MYKIFETHPDHLEGQTDAELERLEKLATQMDASVKIPYTGIKLGLDSIIGLIPGVGDVGMGCVASWIVLRAWRLGAGRGAILHMLWNLGLDVLIGSVPLVGDLFDVAWKANIRNVKLLRRHLYNKGLVSRSSVILERT